MVSVELVGIIMTGVISFLDLGVNCWGMCMKGDCYARVGEAEFEHNEATSVASPERRSRRMSRTAESDRAAERYSGTETGDFPVGLAAGVSDMNPTT